MGKATIGLWGLLAAVAPLHAGVEVVPGAARTGDYGLRAEVEPGCQGETAVLVLGPVVTEQRVKACKEVVVGAQFQDGGTLVAVAGERVSFADGFSVASGGRLAVVTTGAWDPGYVVDETPEREPELHVRWHVDFDGADLAAGDRLTLLRIVSAGIERGWVHYRAGTEGGEVWVETEADDGSRHTGAPLLVAPGWHRLDLEWLAGSILAPTGRAILRVDGGTAVGVTDAALAGAPVDGVELGVVAASASGGWIDLDDYWSGRMPPPLLSFLQ